MRGKVGLVIGVAAGYVLGTRAGRERYEQIKAQALKVWELDPVQAQVARAEAFGKSALAALPKAAWNGVVKVGKAVTSSSTSTPGQKLDAAVKAAKDSAKDVTDAAETSAKAATTAAKRTTAAKSTTTRSTSSRAKKPATEE
jgi:hypothetical protein